VRIAWGGVPAPEPIGQLTVGVSPDGIAWVSFGSGVHGLAAAAQHAGADLTTDPTRTDPAVRQLAEYLAGRRRTVDLPVDWSLSSGAQRQVLQALYDTVGYGETITYGGLAERSGAFGADAGYAAARAVGSIMGSNPVPVVVPCHRVLAADGLGGFGGGLDAKRWLLELEGVLTGSLDFGP
jgi:methylated-DNA-[protein]-cysteine S-methyltransferase